MVIMIRSMFGVFPLYVVNMAGSGVKFSKKETTLIKYIFY